MKTAYILSLSPAQDVDYLTASSGTARFDH